MTCFFGKVSITLSLSCLVLMFSHVAGSTFRGQNQNTVKQDSMSLDSLRSAVMDELLGAMNNSRESLSQQRLDKIEETLKPTYQSLAKNDEGNLDPPSVRYLLHRFFVQRHGMYVKGLEPEGKGWNNSSASEILEDKVPAYVQSLFEERLHGRGMTVHEVAILAATLEHLIHDEALTRLASAYEAHGLSQEANLDEKTGKELVDTYMMLLILGRKASQMLPDDVRRQKELIEQIYPGWSGSQEFAQKVRQDVLESKAAEVGSASGQSFQATAEVVEEIGERYGRWQDGECRDLKSALMKGEQDGTGRVPLKDFYGLALSGSWQFTESVDYLRDLGALDESGPGPVSVIIPNYVNAHSNCLATSSIYSVCCINECEGLMGQLEKEVGGPDVEPSVLANLAQAMPSSTVSAPRQLPSDLLGRLEEVASHHGGKVPLHGRLFAQWMHHAFPRECPYPHVAGSTNPMTAAEWIQEKGNVSVSTSREEMLRHVDAEVVAPATTSASTAASSAASAAESAASSSEPAESVAPLVSSSLPWTLDEELVAKPVARSNKGFMSTVRGLAGLAAVAATLYALSGSFTSGFAAFSGASAEKQKFLLPYAGKQHMC